MGNLQFHIETSPGYGTKQGIMPRFYMQMRELCNFLNTPAFIQTIPEKFLKVIIPELANFYDVNNNLQTTIKEFLDGVKDGTFYKVSEGGDTSFTRKKEFEISNLTKDFFIRGKILLVKYFKSDIVVDGDFKLSPYYFCDDIKFDAKFSQFSSGKKQKYLPLLNVLKNARDSFLNEFSKTRGTIEHDDFELDRFKLQHEGNITTLIEPNFQGDTLSKKIEFYYGRIFELIEKLTVYFAGINCEELNSVYKLYKTETPDYPNLIYGYRYRIMEMPFVVKTVRCKYN